MCLFIYVCTIVCMHVPLETHYEYHYLSRQRFHSTKVSYTTCSCCTLLGIHALLVTHTVHIHGEVHAHVHIEVHVHVHVHTQLCALGI